MRNLSDIFDTLGINKNNGLFVTHENLWQEECQFSGRVARLIKNKLKPDAFFVFDNKPLILFYDSPENSESIHKALWNFNESPVVFFANNSSVEIFNGFNYLKEHSALQRIGDNGNLNDFSYFEIVSGKIWEKYQSELKYENRVDFHLLRNIKTARNLLISKDKLKSEIANALIGKVIFVRYLIDRKVKIGFGEEKYWSTEDFCSILSKKNTAVNFFKYLEEKFNGDMFLLNEADYQSIQQNSLNRIIMLLNEDDLENGQRSLFKSYDFSIIPIEFISNIYESFIGEDNQEKQGAYYTPLFLVDYILKETVDKHLRNNPKQYNCKVLDPACGSGIFLVETLRKIIERYITLHPTLRNDSEDFKEALKTLVFDNIWGIDKNLSAIQVAIFSIYLTLLDYQEPSSVESFKFPNLLHSNFLQADFFNTDHEFNERLKNTELNFILGNPPWKRGKGEKTPLFVKYIKDRKKFENKNKSVYFTQISISNSEIAQAFLLRVSDFSIQNEVALIATSKVLYNLNGQNFRKYFLTNFLINRVFELAPVRHEVFDKSHDPSIAPPVVLFYKPSLDRNNHDNIIEHIALKPSRFFKLFKVFSLTRTDFKKVQQKKLIDYDWLWKTLVYGSYLDFNLIHRLMNSFSSINQISSDKSRFFKGQGAMVGGGDDNDASELIDMPFINTRKDIKAFWINENIKGKWTFKKAHRPRKRILYEPPMLLITGGISNEFKSVSAISTKAAVFRSSLTAIKALNKEDISYLKTMSSILNSSFFAYYALQTFSSGGIEREESHDNEKWTLPFKYSVKIENLYNKLQQLYNDLYSNNSIVSDSLKNEITNCEKQLNESILSTFHFTELEKTLIDYANSVVIPIQMEHNGYERYFRPIIETDDNTLHDYANLFLNRFSKSLNTETHNFITEIWYSRQIIGMFFKIVPNEQNQNPIVWVDKSREELLKIAIKLSSQKITDKLFVQKDLRGFDKDFFYIFKPNERRLWHKAIGYQDVEEFMDAILKTGRRNYCGE